MHTTLLFTNNIENVSINCCVIVMLRVCVCALYVSVFYFTALPSCCCCWSAGLRFQFNVHLCLAHISFIVYICARRTFVCVIPFGEEPFNIRVEHWASMPICSISFCSTFGTSARRNTQMYTRSFASADIQRQEHAYLSVLFFARQFRRKPTEG